jgi:hypothetical protein
LLSIQTHVKPRVYVYTLGETFKLIESVIGVMELD